MKFISIDEEGYPHFSGVRVTDSEVGRTLIQNIRPAPNNSSFETELEGTCAKIEAFDHPLVVQQINESPSLPNELIAILPYDVQFTFAIQDLKVDEWDRFVGLHPSLSVPFVLSRKAQSQLFELCESFDDESVWIGGKQYAILPQYSNTPPVADPRFWDQKYLSTELPGWELGTHHPSLPHISATLKLSKSRILVVGAGSGNDAAYFAKQGHLVTALDFSAEALARGQSKYAEVPNISWIQGDIFDPKLPIANHSFDIVFDHTCFCAVNPEKRQALVHFWSQKLTEGGHLLGIFFTMWRTHAPPFGATEWEIKKRLTPTFSPLYWQRLKPPLALETRLGMELLIYARVTRS